MLPPLVKCNLADSYKPHIIRLFDKNYFVLVNRRDRQIYSKFIDNKHSDKNVIICMGYSILGYFCPCNFCLSALSTSFAPFWIRPDTFVLTMICFETLDSPSLKFARWQRGERSKNKTGANIYLYRFIRYQKCDFSIFWSTDFCRF